MTLLDGTYFGRPVLVTGHTGFKGSWLTLWLHRLGASVTGYSLDPPTDPSNYGESAVGSLISNDVRGDVRDLSRLCETLALSRAEVVFHLAAQPIVRQGIREPRETFETNVMGTVNVLEAVRLAGRACTVIVVTSDKCYEHSGPATAHPESDPLGGTEPYGTSKAAAELVAAAYRTTYFHPDRLAEHGVRVATVRAGNVIGGGDWAPDRLIPDMVRSLSAGRPVPVRHPDAVRPWQHVLEPLYGYLLLASRLCGERGSSAGDVPDDGSELATLCGAWNFGPSPADEIPVRDVVEAALRSWNAGTWEPVADEMGRHEAAELRLRIDKAVSVLGWKPSWDCTEAVRRTISWYRRRHDDPGVDLQSLCLADIEDFESVLVGGENAHRAPAGETKLSHG